MMSLEGWQNTRLLRESFKTNWITKILPCAFHMFLERFFEKLGRTCAKAFRRESKKTHSWKRIYRWCHIDEQVEFVWPYTMFFLHLTKFSFSSHFFVISREKCCHLVKGELVFLRRVFPRFINNRKQHLISFNVVTRSVQMSFRVKKESK